ncbi:response regulator [Leptolyngbya cf. ectocarpi LEGE 11479]|uniref:histidine kinase n=1 Tax=Leptolyngbya cf. ectocarpi LEGE 11479 TaxID=1828722 RepID=A0A928X0R6_LEPEC|nr:response regulator [Leptolyngbya ectocarpi]MBE9065810.1 response regulator [Leptolyngbya cf. ectocarpi LEGE 11479]
MSESVPPVPPYFLQEASELLQQMDEELQTLRQEFSIRKVHTLMRIAHTLKGAAASVGLDTIKTTTHSLEDAFKALCVPDASLSIAVEELIFETYACLQLLLSAQFTNTPIDESDILDRMAGIVSQLQENLGDQFGDTGYLPTSAELGFDMTQSIFEMGVTERLNELENALKHPDADVLVSLLQSQADIFFGLAESLSLPGFGEIVQTTLMALSHSPHKVIDIAQAALADYRAGQASVLQGDRTAGGKPGPVLQKLSGQPSAPPKTQSSDNQRPPLKVVYQRQTTKPNRMSQLWQRLTRPIAGTPKILDFGASQTVSKEEESIPVSEASLTMPETVSEEAVSEEVLSEEALSETIPKTEVLGEATTEALTRLEQAVESNQKKSDIEPLDPEKPSPPSNTPTLRVSIEHLEQLNYAIGELLTQQNRQSLYHKQLTGNLENLSARILQQQKQLFELQQQTVKDSAVIPLSADLKQTSLHQFDPIELEQYSPLQPALGNIIQQLESVEAIDLFARQSHDILTKQQRLVGNLRDTMFDIRMQPVESILQRFHQVLSRLSGQHQKPVTLIIQGGKILIDKSIAEKLYDPLLHLIRNSVAHGIETSDIRQQRNKLGFGTITLNVTQKGRYLTIQIKDDGQGLQLDKISQKAIDSQLITSQEAAQLTPEKIHDLLFEAGFSTANQIDDLSGRGMGLSAVRAQVEALNGSITVTSKTEQWTCFTLRIPTKLTIAKLLLCQASNKQYAIMTDTVQQIVIPTAKQISKREHVKFLSWKFEGKDCLIPVIALSDALNYQATLPNHTLGKGNISSEMELETLLNPIILIQNNNQLVGLEVEHLQEEQELVIHPLGEMVPISTYVYGCSTLTDGRLSLVLDGTLLVQDILHNLSQSVLDIFNTTGQINSNDSTPSLPLAPPKKTILIVDDSITVRNTLATTLQKAGYTVIHAKEGVEALRQLQQVQIDAILCDLEMPGMNGFDFLKVRQRTPDINSVPTIMLTSRAGAKHRLLAKELGATDYLTKPYLAPQLLEKLAAVMTPPTEPQLLEASKNKHA